MASLFTIVNNALQAARNVITGITNFLTGQGTPSGIPPQEPTPSISTSTGFNLNDTSTYRTAIGTMKRNYSYTVQINHTLPNGLQGQQFITVNSNNVLTEEQILSTAQGMLPNSEAAQNLGEINSMTITGATKSAGLG